MWFEFDQNNSGGGFDVDDKLCHRLFIEANGQNEANGIAQDLGVYFDGCDKGLDCDCCGDRWYEGDEKKFPMEWTKSKAFNTVEEYAQHLANEYGWTTPDARIFYKDGRIVEINKEKRC